MSNNTIASSGMGFTSWLTILFIGLKLTNVISWSWVWVLSPIWIKIIIIIVLLIAGVITGAFK
jgi:hypothetical protein